MPLCQWLIKIVFTCFFCSVDCHNCDQMLIRLTPKFAIYRLWGGHFILALMYELQSSLKIFTVTVRWWRTINDMFLSWFSCGFSYIFIYTKNPFLFKFIKLYLSFVHHISLYADFLLHLEGYSLKLCVIIALWRNACHYIIFSDNLFSFLTQKLNIV